MYWLKKKKTIIHLLGERFKIDNIIYFRTDIDLHYRPHILMGIIIWHLLVLH
jgi:hypothetical protein